MAKDPDQTWIYVAREDRKTKGPITDPDRVIEILLGSPIHRCLRASDDTTKVFLDYLPVHDIYKKPHYHLTPNEGRLRVVPFADTTSVEGPVLLGADSNSVTFSIENLVATVNFLP